ncbi:MULTISPECIES: glycoside-pentoside-hexuronide (GPH):cation symporter [unclassified Bacillus (in: firmicutes)]|uniref:glycoside-pentoside-hexuronide (GPH):cation symporter n=1 Tax=Bacillus sp. HSf4 TaxID=3035514 RepID=UPI0004079468|nr:MULTISPECIES: glycoside-pentoside-hexuronide (GPH):cation symporter [unclassified Bacillus (in: firmicutes)]QHZ45622.1 MFS transporter [Bacillus sp. NSP9.1]WFA04573.1 glycoside-pentoside-hexuronide (GPH):cation symporter [Bacillus sp. HSf4]
MEIQTNKQTETVVATQEKLSLKEKVSYGFGDFGNGFMFDLGQLYLLKFFTDVAGIPAAAAGGIFLVSKLFAAVVDPIVGTSIDYRKNIGPKGKFRPYLLYGSIVLAILTVLTFISPNLSPTGKLIYAYASYMLWGLGYSFVNIPYGSLGAAITQNSVERTSLASFRQAGSLGALFVTSIVVIPMIVRFDNPAVGYPVVMGLMSLLGVLFFYICYRNCRERIIVKDQTYNNEKVTLKAISKTFFTNKPLLTLIFMTIFTISAYNLKSAMLVYFAEYNLGNAELMASMNFIIIGSSFIGVMMLPKLVKKFGKKKTAILGLAISVTADIINFAMPSNVILFTLLASIAFIGISIPNGITWAFVSDAIDYGQWRTGERKEGTVYSLFNFSRKLAQSLSGFLSGIGLSIVGYVPNAAQKTGTLLGIKAILLLYPAVALSLAMLVLGYLYRLTDQRHAEMVLEIESRQ